MVLGAKRIYLIAPLGPSKLLLALLLSLAVVAEAEYKDPASLSQADYSLIYSHQGDYEHCLRETSLNIIEQHSDPRQVADRAMKNCAEILVSLHAEMRSENYAPNVANYFTRKISSKSSNKLLNNLMRIMATRDSTKPAADHKSTKQ